MDYALSNGITLYIDTAELTAAVRARTYRRESLGYRRCAGGFSDEIIF